jgi:hypothetical protein
MWQNGGIFGGSQGESCASWIDWDRWVILRMCRNGTGAILSDEEHVARPAWAHAEKKPDGDLQNRPLWNLEEDTGEGDQHEQGHPDIF